MGAIVKLGRRCLGELKRFILFLLSKSLYTFVVGSFHAMVLTLTLFFVMLLLEVEGRTNFDVFGLPATTQDVFPASL
jgi:magnesium-transporting ATPase (P-type)